ncbi:MAG: MarR family transcriptional regulator [Corynebacteriales bacterium]|nr:MarR family transcriptional regulator [Mycobacteriales bacterium]
MRRERGESDLSLSQTSALATLVTQGPKTPSELAACERVKPPSMTRIIAVLEAHGLTSRAQHPTDKRQVIVSATPAGKELVKENRRLREAWLARQLALLSKEQRETLTAAARILDDLSAT